MNKAVIEVDVRVNAEETHDESDKGTVAQAVPNDATTDITNDTTQELGSVLGSAPVNIEQEVRAVLDNSRVQDYYRGNKLHQLFKVK